MKNGEQIYTEFYPKVTGYVCGRIKNYADAEDVVADIFLKVYTGLEGYDEKKAGLSTWIYTIAKNQVIDFYRKRKTEVFFDAGQTNIQIYSDSRINEETGYLMEALESLTEIQRSIVFLHYYCGLGHKEIAGMLRLSYDNVRKICSGSLAALRKRLT